MSRISRLATALGVSAAGIAGGGALVWHRINRIPRLSAERLKSLRADRTNSLFEIFPGLGERLPWMPIGDYPTPLTTVVHPQTGTPILIKRDDLSSSAYGGNKVRKLEFLLAEALLSDADLLVTMGGHGSNHALATAIHGQALGMETELLLYPQLDLPVVRRNYAAMLTAGAKVHPVSGIPEAFARAGQLLVQRRLQGRRPRFVMVGGSSRLGMFGHVSAALELSEQLRTEGLEAPERIFVPLGTCGTAVGLIVGCRLAGLRTRVTAVRVADPFPANASVVTALANDLARTIHALDPDIPLLRIGNHDFDVLTDYLGSGYGIPTEAGQRAVATVDPLLKLETTYSGKTFAACLDAIHGDPTLKALFWDTYSSAPLPNAEHRNTGPEALRHLTMDVH